MNGRPPAIEFVSRKCEFINKICHIRCDNKNIRKKRVKQTTKANIKAPKYRQKFHTTLSENIYVRFGWCRHIVDAEELLLWMHRIASKSELSECEQAALCGNTISMRNWPSSKWSNSISAKIRTFDKEAVVLHRSNVMLNFKSKNASQIDTDIPFCRLFIS